MGTSGRFSIETGRDVCNLNYMELETAKVAVQDTLLAKKKEDSIPVKVNW